MLFIEFCALIPLLDFYESVLTSNFLISFFVTKIINHINSLFLSFTLSDLWSNAEHFKSKILHE